MDFAISADHRIKVEESKVPRPCQGTKNIWNIKMTVIPIVINALENGLINGLSDLQIREDHQNYGMIKIGWNTERGPGGLRILAVSKTREKDHQFTLLRKASEGVSIIIKWTGWNSKG